MNDLVARFIAHTTAGGFPLTGGEWDALPWPEARLLLEMVQEFSTTVQA